MAKILTVMPVPVVQFFDNAGLPLASGQVFTYAAGTTTPLATFKDSAGANTNLNPTILDANGMAVIYLDLLNYKIDVQTAAGVSIRGYPKDNIMGGNALGSVLYTYPAADGLANQLLQTNGSKVLAWGPAAGTAALPSLSFAGDTTSGFYRNGANALSWSASGVQTVALSAAGINVVVAGTVGAPSLVFGGDATSGFYRNGANNLSFSALGTQIAALSATGINIVLAGTVAAPSLVLASDGTTGLYRSAANELSIASAGVQSLKINAQAVISSPTQPRASAFSNVTQVISNATLAGVTFTTADFNIGTLWVVGNPTRFTIPTGGDGLYLLHAKVNFVNTATGVLWALEFRKNGAAIGTRMHSPPNNVATTGTILSCTELVPLVAADYVEIFIYQDSGANMSIGSAIRSQSNEMFVVKVW